MNTKKTDDIKHVSVNLTFEKHVKRVAKLNTYI